MQRRRVTPANPGLTGITPSPLPFGVGWSHSLQGAVAVTGDGFQGLGEDSALDAAAAIVGLYVQLDVFKQGQDLLRMMLSALIGRWWADQFNDNRVAVTYNGNPQLFIRLPDDSYNPPPGVYATLIPNPVSGVSFRLAAQDRLTSAGSRSDHASVPLAPICARALYHRGAAL
jgi:hypothetical protein